MTSTIWNKCTNKCSNICRTIRRFCQNATSSNIHNQGVIAYKDTEHQLDGGLVTSITPYTLDISPKSAFTPYVKKFDNSASSFINVNPPAKQSIKRVNVRKYVPRQKNKFQTNKFQTNRMVYISSSSN